MSLSPLQQIETSLDSKSLLLPPKLLPLTHISPTTATTLYALIHHSFTGHYAIPPLRSPDSRRSLSAAMEAAIDILSAVDNDDYRLNGGPPALQSQAEHEFRRLMAKMKLQDVVEVLCVKKGAHPIVDSALEEIIGRVHADGNADAFCDWINLGNAPVLCTVLSVALRSEKEAYRCLVGQIEDESRRREQAEAEIQLQKRRTEDLRTMSRHSLLRAIELQKEKDALKQEVEALRLHQSAAERLLEEARAKIAEMEREREVERETREVEGMVADMRRATEERERAERRMREEMEREREVMRVAEVVARSAAASEEGSDVEAENKEVLRGKWARVDELRGNMETDAGANGRVDDSGIDLEEDETMVEEDQAHKPEVEHVEIHEITADALQATGHSDSESSSHPIAIQIIDPQPIPLPIVTVLPTEPESAPITTTTTNPFIDPADDEINDTATAPPPIPPRNREREDDFLSAVPAPLKMRSRSVSPAPALEPAATDESDFEVAESSKGSEKGKEPVSTTVTTAGVDSEEVKVEDKGEETGEETGLEESMQTAKEEKDDREESTVFPSISTKATAEIPAAGTSLPESTPAVTTIVTETLLSSSHIITPAIADAPNTSDITFPSYNHARSPTRLPRPVSSHSTQPPPNSALPTHPRPTYNAPVHPSLGISTTSSSSASSTSPPAATSSPERDLPALPPRKETLHHQTRDYAPHPLLSTASPAVAPPPQQQQSVWGLFHREPRPYPPLPAGVASPVTGTTQVNVVRNTGGAAGREAGGLSSSPTTATTTSNGNGNGNGNNRTPPRKAKKPRRLSTWLGARVADEEEEQQQQEGRPAEMEEGRNTWPWA